MLEFLTVSFMCIMHFSLFYFIFLCASIKIFYTDLSSSSSVLYLTVFYLMLQFYVVQNLVFNFLEFQFDIFIYSLYISLKY